MNRLAFYMTVAVLCWLACLPGAAIAQTVQDASCPLTNFRDGQIVTLNGEVSAGPHDMTFTVPGCHEVVVLVYAGEEGSGLSGDELQHDQNLADFRRYTSAVYKQTRKNSCMQCARYRVQATLVGKLSIAPDTIPEGQWKDKLGMLHDKSGKFVGKAGFGHPPVYRHCMAIKSVSDLKVRELPEPAASKPGDGAILLHEAEHLKAVAL